MFGKNKKSFDQAPSIAIENNGPRVRMFYSTIGGGSVTPCARESDIAQVGTIIAPISIVPYMSIQQPLNFYDEENS